METMQQASPWLLLALVVVNVVQAWLMRNTKGTSPVDGAPAEGAPKLPSLIDAGLEVLKGVARRKFSWLPPAEAIQRFALEELSKEEAEDEKRTAAYLKTQEAKAESARLAS